MKNTLVSLVIPAYNVENLIGYTLDSVVNQTLGNFECIIVDDYSIDDTKRVALDYVRRDKRFKLLSHRANAGLSAARNTGLRFAKGKYVAFLDSDDLLMPESLELRANSLNSHTNDDFVVGTYAGSITIPMDAKIPPAKRATKLRLIDFITAGGNCPFNANQPMFKTEKLRMFGGFDHSLKQAEDYDMWMRVLRAGYTFIPTDYALVTYRKTEGSMIKSNPLLHLDTSYNRFMGCYNTYPKEYRNRKLKVNLAGGLSTYIAQLNIASRVLEFVGLGLAKGESSEKLVTKLCAYLPNYFEIIERHRPFELGVEKGVNRYFGNADNVKDKQHLKKKAQEIYKLFSDNTIKRVDTSEIRETQVKTSDIVSKIGVQRRFDVVFVPHKDYHVHAIKLMEPFLQEHDISFIVLDISMHYRDEGVADACERYKMTRVGYSNFILGDFEPRALVCFNDWDPIVRTLIKAANYSNIPTLGIVEGIQDYLDADTKQQRWAYRTVKNLALPGEHDRKYFRDSKQNIFVGGIPRIFDLFHSYKDVPIELKGKRVLINSNFSYGVLEEYRDSWLISAVNACRSAGYEVSISKHPADKGKLFEELTTKDSFYTAMDKSDILISRFASGILEALAIRKLPIYFNPHGEKVDKFKQPEGAFPIVSSEAKLVEVLNSPNRHLTNARGRFSDFLKFHCGSLEFNPSETIVKKLKSILDGNEGYNYKRFYRSLENIDHYSGCFNNINLLRNCEPLELESNLTTFNELVVTRFYRLLRAKEYSIAHELITSLLTSEPENPAYKSCQKLLNDLSALKSREKI